MSYGGNITDKLVLFDINNLLIKDSKDVSDYVSESIRNIYGVIVSVNIKNYEGLTSQEVVEQVLKQEGIPDNEISMKQNRYVEDLFYTYFNVAGHDRQILVDGAKELLEELSKRGAMLGIATGEAERIVKLRLDKTGIGSYFKCGGYGGDGKEMDKIINSALEKARAAGFDGSSVFIITSSPQSVRSAKMMGLGAIGIASGKYSIEELESASANVVTKSLKDRGKILGVVSK